MLLFDIVVVVGSGGCVYHGGVGGAGGAGDDCGVGVGYVLVTMMVAV